VAVVTFFATLHFFEPARNACGFDLQQYTRNPYILNLGNCPEIQDN
jgi:hypothetical protein